MSKKRQVLNLAAEMTRVASGSIKYGSQDTMVKEACERALDLIDLTLEDSRWRKEFLQWRYLRDAVVSLYLGKADPVVAKLICHWLMGLSERA